VSFVVRDDQVRVLGAGCDTVEPIWK